MLAEEIPVINGSAFKIKVCLDDRRFQYWENSLEVVWIVSSWNTHFNKKKKNVINEIAETLIAKYVDA